MADRAQRDDARRPHRHLERATLRERHPRGDLRHQVGPPVVLVGAGGAEAAHRGDDQRRELLAHGVARQTEALEVTFTQGLDHDVGRTEELDELRPAGLVGRDRDRALVGVEVHEALGQPPLRIAPGRLDLDHVGPEVGEDLGAVRPGRFARQLDDRQVTEKLAHGRRIVAPPSEPPRRW